MRVFLLFILVSVSTFADDAKSVYKVAPYVDGAIIVGGLLGGGIPYLLENSIITKRCPCDPNEVNAFDRPAIGNNSAFARGYSDVLLATAIAAPIIVDYLDVGWGDTFLEDTTVFVQTLAVNGALVSLIKHAVQRPIPLAYSGQKASEAEGYRSFYSGHVATFFAAFTSASMTWYLRHHPGAWPWIVGTALGTTVAVARVAGGNHFATDVIVGGLVGTAIGLVVPWLHKKESPSERVVLAPLGDSGVQLLYFSAF